MSDQPFLDAVVEMSWRRILQRIDREVVGALTADMQSGDFIHWDPPQEPFDLGRFAAIMQQMRDTPELRFQQTRLVPRSQMFKVMEVQRDPKTGQAFQLMLIRPDDVPAVRAALLERAATEPSIIRPMLPQGLEPGVVHRSDDPSAPRAVTACGLPEDSVPAQDMVLATGKHPIEYGEGRTRCLTCYPEGR